MEDATRTYEFTDVEIDSEIIDDARFAIKMHRELRRVRNLPDVKPRHAARNADLEPRADRRHEDSDDSMSQYGVEIGEARPALYGIEQHLR